MLNELRKCWGGEIQVLETPENGANGHIHIKLLPKRESREIGGKTRVSGQDNAEGSEVEITVKQYMTKKASPTFDFMAKWNNDNPMPLRKMTGRKVKETKGMAYYELHGLGRETITCAVCGRELTNPVSRRYGIGPECLGKLGLSCSMDDVDGVKEGLAELKWSGWVIKSAIINEEEA